MYAGDCDRLVVVGKNGRTLPGFRSMMHRDDPEGLREVATTKQMAKQGTLREEKDNQPSAKHLDKSVSQDSSS